MSDVSLKEKMLKKMVCLFNLEEEQVSLFGQVYDNIGHVNFVKYMVAIELSNTDKSRPQIARQYRVSERVVRTIGEKMGVYKPTTRKLVKGVSRKEFTGKKK